MKIYKTQKEVDSDLVHGNLVIDDSVKFECNITIDGSIKAGDIYAWDIEARNINAGDINAWDIKAIDIHSRDIKAVDIDTRNINAGDIDAVNINAGDIDAWNIIALNINAWDIRYRAFCIVYNSIKCISIKGRREPHSKPICLDGKLTIIGEEIETIEIGGIKYDKAEVEAKLKDIKPVK